MTTPVIRILRGELTDDELAALTAVLTALGAPAPDARPRPARRGRCRPQARWRRLERQAGYRSPASWR